jgi:alanyl-tRNA synthetase
MQYDKTVEGKYNPLKQKNVDTGMGLERTVLVLNNLVDPYQVDTCWPIIQKLEELSGREYIESIEVTKSMRIIVDHLRATVMIMGDNYGVAPSNTDQGYIVRRLIRRAIRHGKLIGLKENFTTIIAEVIINIFQDVYSEVEKNKEFVMLELAKEESKFRNTIEQGIKEFEKLLNGLRMAFEKTGQNITEISAKQAFKLYDTYGFPLEMTMEMAGENGMTVDADGFHEEFKKHQDLSRVGAEQKFKGGLADDGEMSKKYHTATHLLHHALRQILGEHVAQKGSNITDERMRFDFNHPEKMTDVEIAKVEKIVNQAIEADYAVKFEEMNLGEAKKLGAIGLFADKYGDKVKVYTIGDAGKEPFSQEICGGPHAERTGELGEFKIIKEESSSSGVRRIKAVLR